MRADSEIKNRGTRDVLMVVCDGLKGLPDAVNAVPHLQRGSRSNPTYRSVSTVLARLVLGDAAASRRNRVHRTYSRFSCAWSEMVTGRRLGQPCLGAHTAAVCPLVNITASSCRVKARRGAVYRSRSRMGVTRSARQAANPTTG